MVVDITQVAGVDGVHEIKTLDLFSHRPVKEKIRWDKEEEKQERTHLPLPESFPQPLDAGGIRVKMLDKAEEKRRADMVQNIRKGLVYSVYSLSVK